MRIAAASVTWRAGGLAKAISVYYSFERHFDRNIVAVNRRVIIM
jgi:hypothetical protein